LAGSHGKYDSIADCRDEVVRLAATKVLFWQTFRDEPTQTSGRHRLNTQGNEAQVEPMRAGSAITQEGGV